LIEKIRNLFYLCKRLYLKDIKSPELEIKYSDLKLPPITKIGIRTLTSFIKKTDFTHDLMIINTESGKIKICKAIFIAYVRWLLPEKYLD
jgi:hypothetical protein